MSVDRLDIEAASDRIAGRVRHTPMIRVQVGDSRLFLKLELLQHTGSFKPRGAFNRTLGADSIPSAGVIAASGGNHGLAVAHVARELGLPAEVFVPRVSPAVKVDAIGRLGARVTVTGAMYHDALAAAESREAETGALSIHAYDHELTVAGQGTMAKEITEQLEDVGEVVIAVGGGGFVAGAVAWLGSSTPVIAVEPNGSAALHHALAAGTNVGIGSRRLHQGCPTVAVAGAQAGCGARGRYSIRRRARRNPSRPCRRIHRCRRVRCEY